ncbi:MAG: ABC transporter ATP-binding protein [Clostridiales bacterium]|jgi:ABC-2 type transport system ATP-binding protein|nr:ABC transporter ATP-binding protein [Clostridiales bacterium]
MLNIQHITKCYAKSPVPAVDDLSLHVPRGVVYGFLGPNGAGKTTTIKMLTGILPFERGDIFVNGYSICKNPTDAKRRLGYVSDDHAVYDTLTGRQYINFLADVYGVSVTDRKSRAADMLERLNLTDALDTQIAKYSHGMKQKICVVGALIHNPPLWVLDEPLTGLDPESAFQLKSMMTAHAAAGNTVFFSTHVLEVAEKVCSHIGVVYHGRLLADESVEALLAKNGGESLEQWFLQLTGGKKPDDRGLNTPISTPADNGQPL